MQETDGHLLTRFATHRDETAFKTLANRHLGLIYHVALRRTGNRQIAEEVSQNVLCAVVRKAAGLARHPDRLPAWLHRATLFESSKAMRSEASNQRRKQLLHPDGIAATGDVETSAWNAALPVLDLALDRLPDADRNVVLRHYFEGKFFNQIGEEVSRPAATVQKQCRRALDKLRRLLRGKGVALSATALASGLASHTADAAPAALMKSAAAKALAGAGTHSTASLTLFMAMKSKAALPTALALLALPLALQQLAISSTASHNDRLRQALAAPEPTTARRTATPTKPRTVATGERRVTIDRLMRAFGESQQSTLKRERSWRTSNFSPPNDASSPNIRRCRSWKHPTTPAPGRNFRRSSPSPGIGCKPMLPTRRRKSSTARNRSQPTASGGKRRDPSKASPTRR